MALFEALEKIVGIADADKISLEDAEKCASKGVRFHINDGKISSIEFQREEKKTS